MTAHGRDWGCLVGLGGTASATGQLSGDRPGCSFRALPTAASAGCSVPSASQSAPGVSNPRQISRRSGSFVKIRVRRRGRESCVFLGDARPAVCRRASRLRASIAEPGRHARTVLEGVPTVRDVSVRNAAGQCSSSSSSSSSSPSSLLCGSLPYSLRFSRSRPWPTPCRRRASSTPCSGR